ncbi:hypothetical protein C0992_001495, partial [Termitomyces sp. T32_za158]
VAHLKGWSLGQVYELLGGQTGVAVVRRSPPEVEDASLETWPAWLGLEGGEGEESEGEVGVAGCESPEGTTTGGDDDDEGNSNNNVEDNKKEDYSNNKKEDEDSIEIDELVSEGEELAAAAGLGGGNLKGVTQEVSPMDVRGGKAELSGPSVVALGKRKVEGGGGRDEREEGVQGGPSKHPCFSQAFFNVSMHNAQLGGGLRDLKDCLSFVWDHQHATEEEVQGLHNSVVQANMEVAEAARKDQEVQVGGTTGVEGEVGIGTGPGSTTSFVDKGIQWDGELLWDEDLNVLALQKRLELPAQVGSTANGVSGTRAYILSKLSRINPRYCLPPQVLKELHALEDYEESHRRLSFNLHRTLERVAININEVLPGPELTLEEQWQDMMRDLGLQEAARKEVVVDLTMEP